MNDNTECGQGEVMDPRELLKSLQWKEDQKIVNYFGETVWLKRHYTDDKCDGITECCFAEEDAGYDEPCDWHKSIAENLKPAPPKPVPKGIRE